MRCGWKRFYLHDDTGVFYRSAEANVAEEILTDEFLRQLIDVGEVDILIGLPTHNNAKTIGPILHAIQAGILKCFPRERAVIINADGGSRDGTPELVAGASIDDVRRAPDLHALRTLHSISTQYATTPAPGVALHTILAAAELLRARACVVISPASASFEPEWLVKLLRPVYSDKFDLVMPLYRRHKFEGPLVSNLIYPMMRALYGVRIREPYAADFGFSGKLGSQFLTLNVWNREWGRTGPEIYLTIAAITNGSRISQTFLGTKTHVDHSANDLVPAMRRTVGALFSSLEDNLASWSTSNGSESLPSTGATEVTLDPVRVNRKRLWEMFQTGIRDLDTIFRSILSPPTLTELHSIATLGEEDFNYPASLWVRTVYEFAVSYRKSTISRDHVLQALAPLYRGRMFTFLLENRNASGEEVEANIEILCREFEELKPYLLELWKRGE
jgi:glucosylglycerate synthase